jgi:hypothetical protein
LDEVFLQQLYNDLELFLYDENLPIVEVIPLYNFDSNVEFIDLDDGLSIRKISKEEESFFYNNASFDFFEISSWRYLIEYKYYAEKIFTYNSTKSTIYDSTDKVINPLVTLPGLSKKVPLVSILSIRD